MPHSPAEGNISALHSLMLCIIVLFNSLLNKASDAAPGVNVTAARDTLMQAEASRTISAEAAVNRLLLLTKSASQPVGMWVGIEFLYVQ